MRRERESERHNQSESAEFFRVEPAWKASENVAVGVAALAVVVVVVAAAAGGGGLVGERSDSMHLTFFIFSWQRKKQLVYLYLSRHDTASENDNSKG